MARMSITFDGFSKLAEEIDKANGNLTKAVDEALTKTQEVVKSNLVPASQVYAKKGRKGYATGEMYKALIKDTDVVWKGTVAEVRVGFNLTQKGGFHSIFIMYGTPRMKPDLRVKNAIRGSRTKQDIAEVQEETLRKYIMLDG